MVAAKQNPTPAVKEELMLKIVRVATEMPIEDVSEVCDFVEWLSSESGRHGEARSRSQQATMQKTYDA